MTASNETDLYNSFMNDPGKYFLMPAWLTQKKKISHCWCQVNSVKNYSFKFVIKSGLFTKLDLTSKSDVVFLFSSLITLTKFSTNHFLVFKLFLNKLEYKLLEKLKLAFDPTMLLQVGHG